MSKSSVYAAITALVSCLTSTLPAFAAPGFGPSPPCGPPVWHASALAGSPPRVAAWTLTQLPREWALEHCVGWERQRFAAFAAVVGTFQADGMEAVVGRIGAISTFKGLRYWSVTDRRLEALIIDAFAVEGPTLKQGRSDFTPTEMQVGRDLFFTERDNRSSEPVLYRMRIVERSPDRLVVDIANASRVRLFLLTLFEPGDLRTALFIYGTADGRWTCYAVLGFHPRSLAGLLENPKSHINRLIALYGHVAASDDSELPWAKE